MFFVYLYIFQNISCYCLSCFLALFSRTCQNFKTSHVIVYLRSCTHFLSNSDNFKTSHVIVYQYRESHWLVCSSNFKTSHVIVYLNDIPYNHIWNIHFKTSHVIVYRIWGVERMDKANRFQNISCYCLSNSFRIQRALSYTFQNISCYCLSS